MPGGPKAPSLQLVPAAVRPNSQSHASNMLLMKNSMNPFCDFGIEQVDRSKMGITTGRFRSFSTSVWGK